MQTITRTQEIAVVSKRKVADTSMARNISSMSIHTISLPPTKKAFTAKTMLACSREITILLRAIKKLLIIGVATTECIENRCNPLEMLSNHTKKICTRFSWIILLLVYLNRSACCSLSKTNLMALTKTTIAIASHIPSATTLTLPITWTIRIRGKNRDRTSFTINNSKRITNHQTKNENYLKSFKWVNKSERLRFLKDYEYC